MSSITINLGDAFLLDTPPNKQHLYDESVIAYRYAREYDASELAKRITSGSPIPKGYCSATVLEQIQRGGLVSKRWVNESRDKYKDAIKACLEIS